MKIYIRIFDLVARYKQKQKHYAKPCSLYYIGVPNVLSVKVRNKAGLSSSISSPSVIVDTTAPYEGLVTCPQYAQVNYNGDKTVVCAKYIYNYNVYA